MAVAVAVDGSGNLYVTGTTNSTDFEGANNAYHGGAYDGFVAKLTSAGVRVWATYLGGSGDDEAGGIAVDSAGNAFVSGFTASTDFAGATNSRLRRLRRLRGQSHQRRRAELGQLRRRKLR